MAAVSSAGLVNAMPTSFDVWDTFTPPSPVNCGVFGSFRKLKTELPPRVCPCISVVSNKPGIIIADLTGYEYEKSFLNAKAMAFVIALKLKLPHENGGVPFNP
jgi:hypothetical protein